MSKTVQNLSVQELCENILKNHHDYIRDQGPVLVSRLRSLGTEKALADLPLKATTQLLKDMLHELGMHMLKEESILFPYCQRLDLAESSFDMHCGSVKNPIQVMEREHRQCEEQSKLLQGFITELSQAEVPKELTKNYKKTLDLLTAFIKNLELHIYKEEQLLFPQAVKKEIKLRPLQQPKHQV